MKTKAAVLYRSGLPRPYAESQPLVVDDVEPLRPGRRRSVGRGRRRGDLPLRSLGDRRFPATGHADAAGARGGGNRPRGGAGRSLGRRGRPRGLLLCAAVRTLYDVRRRARSALRNRIKSESGRHAAQRPAPINEPIRRNAAPSSGCLGLRAVHRGNGRVAGADRRRIAAGESCALRLRGDDGRRGGREHGQSPGRQLPW